MFKATYEENVLTVALLMPRHYLNIPLVKLQLLYVNPSPRNHTIHDAPHKHTNAQHRRIKERERRGRETHHTTPHHTTPHHTTPHHTTPHHTAIHDAPHKRTNAHTPAHSPRLILLSCANFVYLTGVQMVFVSYVKRKSNLCLNIHLITV
jgi:hypothetical protein